MDHINRLPGLERLSLEETQITDAGLTRLKILGQLDDLNLAGTQITDADHGRPGKIAAIELSLP